MGISCFYRAEPSARTKPNEGSAFMRRIKTRKNHLVLKKPIKT